MILIHFNPFLSSAMYFGNGFDTVIMNCLGKKSSFLSLDLLYESKFIGRSQILVIKKKQQPTLESVHSSSLSQI